MILEKSWKNILAIKKSKYPPYFIIHSFKSDKDKKQEKMYRLYSNKLATNGKKNTIFR